MTDNNTTHSVKIGSCTVCKNPCSVGPLTKQTSDNIAKGLGYFRH